MFDIDKKTDHTSGGLRGFSLGELLVVIVIVMLLAITVIMAYRNQIAKAHDAQRKEHFNKFKVMFEDYYNDSGCYPSEDLWDGCSCDSDCLTPYMDKFLCDPITKQKYLYLPFTDTEDEIDPCMGYRLYAKLENRGDPDIEASGCSFIMGCGFDEPLSLYNYGIAMGGPLTASDFIPNPTSPPTPSPTPREMGSNFCLGDGSRRCNIKTGCAPDYEKQACHIVLINVFGCQGFVNADECSSLCQTNYETYKCPATETLPCYPWRRPQCQ